MKILLTGFDPFGGETLNPAWETVLAVASRQSEGKPQLIPLQVPTVFGKSIETVTSAIDEHQPDYIICLGQAAGQSQIRIERIAINVSDGSIPDNEGNKPTDEPIVAQGPDAYFTTLPNKQLIHDLRKHGIPVSISNTAGTYVCNHLAYGVLHHISTTNLSTKAGFVHVPLLPEQAVEHNNRPSMSLDLIVNAVSHIIEYLAE